MKINIFVMTLLGLLITGCASSEPSRGHKHDRSASGEAAIR